MLAAHGYPTLSLANFEEPGLPQTLANLPLEYFVKALALLRRQPGVDPKHVLVFGVSRGSEAALLLGAHFPSLVDGVIAGVPSSVVNVGLSDHTSAAWTLAGHPIPYEPVDELGDADPADVPAAVIPVEQIRGPVFTACGQDDQVWPSCKYAAAIKARLTAHNFPYARRSRSAMPA
jgi:pimeloyl-ACP methyl ester carboxylesterase